ncbi:MAG: SusC/RagA family TonB-linked outer membrane protein, partial [Alistipes sp.]|nr:SusC/RagA family TonB-linked outer membrane protein [Alistipes sp.]
GVELALTSTNIRTKKFSWKTSLNLAFIRTEIRDIYGDGKDDIDNKWFIGNPIKVNYDYYITGVWQLDEANLAAGYGAQPGYAKYDDLNGNGTYDADDRQIIGSPEPNVTWSLNNQFTYGPLELVVYLYGATGMVKYNPFYAKNILVNRNFWTPDNPTNDYWTKDDGSANQYIASKSVTPGKYEKANFWRVKDITLAYTLPKRWLSKVGVSNTRIYVSCKNPFTFTDYTGMDPELDEQRAKPVQREYIFGLNLTF